MKKQILATQGKKVEKIVKSLHVLMPEGDFPTLLKLIYVFTLIGGSSVIGSLFVDIAIPGSQDSISFYILRLIIGCLAVATAYMIARNERWAMWFYGVIAVTGLFVNSIASVIPLLVLLYLFLIRKQFKPSVLDDWLEKYTKITIEKASVVIDSYNKKPQT